MVATIEKLSEHNITRIEEIISSELLYVDKDNINPEIAKNVEILIGRDRDMNIELLEFFKQLKMIFIINVGVEKLPFDYLADRNITVTHVGGDICSETIAEYVLGAMLSFNCNFLLSFNNKINHYWKKFQTISSIKGKNVFILGYGAIGKEIAKKVKLLNCNIYISSMAEKQNDNIFDEWFCINDLIHKINIADFVICTLPLTKNTYHLFDKKIFSNMKSSSVFINIARGDLVNEEDLVYALQNNIIAGAALDVFSKEPLDKQSILWDLPNAILTPHTSGRIENFIDHAIEYFISNYNAYIQNKQLPNLVDLNRGY